MRNVEYSMYYSLLSCSYIHVFFSGSEMQSWFQIVVCVCMLASLILSVCLGNPVQSSLREEERQVTEYPY